MAQYLGSVMEEDRFNMEFGTYGRHDRPLTTILLGTKYLAKKMYQLSPIEVRLKKYSVFYFCSKS